MISIELFIESIKNSGVRKGLQKLEKELPQKFSSLYHGDFIKWKHAMDSIIQEFPALEKANDFDITSDTICVGCSIDFNKRGEKLIQFLREFMPWRKGPYNFFGLDIDCEWRSDMKWNRLINHISSLQRRSVLDIGCGNGYHCWRMLGAGAETVLGIDPVLLYIMQFNLFKYYLPFKNIQVLPFAVDVLPQEDFCFDTVFSMGILYHRRSPIDHLLDLRRLVRDEGELVLETLVIDGEQGKILVPEDRYAKMRNVWFIPSVLTLEGWLKRCGFKEIKVVDIQFTSLDEQRVTPWMEFESLAHFLDTENRYKTIEGYPAPKRAIFVCSN
jgi:tRNA (mo5U34)-methyltransferase